MATYETSLLGREVGSVQDQESIPLPFGDLTMMLGSTALQSATRVVPDWHLCYLYSGLYGVFTRRHERRHEMFPLPTAISSRTPVEIVEVIMNLMETKAALCSAALVCYPMAWSR